LNVFIRADASAVIGHGHVTRCLTLADALSGLATVHFICRDDEGNLLDRIEQHGCRAHRLPAGSIDEAQDAAATHRMVAAVTPRAEWLIVDHYGLDARWERRVRHCAKRIMVIDDLADRPHACDLLLDQNLIADMSSRYVGKVPTDCRVLLGPEYALLQPIYRELRKDVEPRRSVRRILIFWSGADRDDLTSRSLAACLSLQRPDVLIDVVTAASYPHTERLRTLAAPHAHVRILSDLPTLAPLMAQADLGIGAAGTTSWERICLGLPTIAASIAENQRGIAEELGRQGLIRYLGHCDGITEDVLAGAVRSTLDHDLDAWSQRCLSVLDGKGTIRVVQELIGSGGVLFARPAERRDEDRLLEWANDPLTRKNAFTSAVISPQEHHEWFLRRLAAPLSRIFIIESGGNALGQVRFDRTDAVWTISYALAPAFRGRGLGRQLLDAALHRMRAEFPDARVVGLVKETNIPSCRVFEALGFEAQRTDGVMEYRRAV
jgi:UDP-2,4-diacetamido-2,4,6-trideoxy-beta-L-altropyranose hydrolase